MAQADEGHNIKCTVTATNTQGSASADSNTVVPTAVPAPTNSVAPAITGTPTTGQAVTCSQGTWTGSPTGYAYQWKRNGSSISGATSSVYTLQVADEGTAVNCTVTATNAGGSTPADSNTINPTSGSVFDPATLSPTYWVKPRTLDGSQATGSDVTGITDSSASARAFTSNSTVKPILTKNVLDGKSVIDFNKAGQTDLHHDLFPSPSVTQGFEVWTVFGLSDFPGDYGGGNRQVVWGGAPGSQAYMALTPGEWDDAAPYYAGLFAGTLVDTQVIGTNRAAGMTFRLQRAVVNGASSFIERNGVQIAGPIDPGTAGLGGLYLAHSGGFGGFADLRLAEILVLPLLTNTQRDNLISYFRATFPSLGL
jgi:hypothetical protein